MAGTCVGAERPPSLQETTHQWQRRSYSQGFLVHDICHIMLTIYNRGPLPTYDTCTFVSGRTGPHLNWICGRRLLTRYMPRGK
ncbi:hypothetical protein VTN02DRAFT_1856 [Thermoascus thermophilus]